MWIHSLVFIPHNLKGAVPEKKEDASPLEAQSFDQFPRTYIEVAEFDSLHDDGVLLADRLREEKNSGRIS
ncbi:alpha/beta hydrolase fold domain-containing protein [Butyrivibrio fibrisolvens]|uniref:alpha/beta hydrolase fold domain-containing protein n=1 Tax=Butyrivibrio fibrisolvens TaxID=831 RepID=UPI003B50505C